MSHTSTPGSNGPEAGLDLLTGVGSEVYRINAFRVTGLQVDARPRDISRHLEKLEMMAKFGQSNGNLGPLPLDPPPGADNLREARQRLNDPQRRIIDEFFWFWPDQLGQAKNDEALQALTQGNSQIATQIWIRNENDHSEANVAMHNLAVLSHAWALDFEHVGSKRALTEKEKNVRDTHWMQAYARWGALRSHAAFWNRLSGRIREFDDPRLTTDAARRMQESLPLALLSISAHLAIRAAERGDSAEAQRHLRLMLNASFGKNLADEAIRNALSPSRERIKGLCQTAESRVSTDPAQGGIVAEQLVRDATPLLAALDSLLVAGNSARDAAHDDVALMALRCQIAFGNKTENWLKSLELLGSILPIAASEPVRAKIQENLEIVRRNKEFGTCFFCGKKPTEPNHEAAVTMYGNVKSSYAGYNQINRTWNYNTFKVPRCSGCAHAHSMAASAKLIGRVLACLLVFAFAISTQWWADYLKGDDSIGWFFFFGAVLTFSTPLYLWRAVGRVLTNGRAGEDKKYEFSKIEELKKQGWRFGANPQAAQQIPQYKPDRGKRLGDWKPFHKWVAGKRPIFVSMFLLLIPVPVICALAPILWSVAEGAPAATLNLYQIGLLSKSNAAERLARAAADKSRSGPYRDQALGELGDMFPSPDPAAQSAIPILRDILKHSDPVPSRFQIATSNILLKISPETAVESLTTQLSASDANVKRQAAWKLGEMGVDAQTAVAALERTVDGTNSGVSQAAVAALLKIAPETEISKLITDIETGSSPDVRMSAARILGTIGPSAKASIPALKKALKDDNSGVTEEASVALRAIDPNWQPTVRREPRNLRTYSAVPTPAETPRITVQHIPDLRAQSLSLEISSEKLRLSGLASSLNQCKQQLNSYASSMNNDRQRLDQIQSNARLGLNVDKYEYDRVLNEYNSYVPLYNSQLQSCQSIGREHDDLVDQINSKVREYNSLIGAR
jgi:hypothetical protein